ncbi:MAG: hypothetical protein HDT33_03640 [Clostridiales bacterium]|nr:hypothetical protein [Clostridiales bacterium]
MNTVIEQTNFVQPTPLQRCTVYEAETFMEAVASACTPNNLQQYRRVDKRHYVDTRTGELKEYQKQERPPDDLSFYSRSFNELRRIIFANFTGSSAECHVTLTVAPGLSATLSDLQEYFRKFFKKFHYHYPICEYLTIAEPHQNGRYHLHVLLLNTSGNSLCISNEKIQQWWRMGQTYICKVRKPEVMANYFCSVKKQRRWAEHYYPNHRLFRCSNGISRLQKRKMTRKEVSEYAEEKGFHFVSGRTYQISQGDTEGGVQTVNVVTRERFRR